MAGTLVPPWWKPSPPQQSAIILASFCWGFTMSLAFFCCTKAFCQTNRAWRRSHHFGAYIIMVWLLTVANIVVAVCSWLYMMDMIPPRQAIPLC